MNASTLAEYRTLADDLINEVRTVLTGGARRDYVTRASEVVRILCAEVERADERAAEAEARGRADALAEVDAAAMACWTESPDGEVHLSRSNAGWFIESPTLWTPSPDDDALTPTAAILAAAAALGGDA